jgi:hypothetical protein
VVREVPSRRDQVSPFVGNATRGPEQGEL